MGSAKTPEDVSSDFSLMVIGSFLLFTLENTPRNRDKRPLNIRSPSALAFPNPQSYL